MQEMFEFNNEVTQFYKYIYVKQNYIIELNGE